MKNIAFIDGQNLHLGTWGSEELVSAKKLTQEERWMVDNKKFREYLKNKYNIEEAYYFLGYIDEENESLYDDLQKAGFILKFKGKSKSILSTKKGNIDTELVFFIMKMLIEKPEELDKAILVSGDGDYIKLVEYLIKKDKFLKILFPNKKFASSLYKRITHTYFSYIIEIKDKIKK